MSVSSRHKTTDFKNDNKATQVVSRNEVRLRRKTSKALKNAYRLRSVGKGKEFGRNVAEYYKFDTLDRYVRIESAVLVGFVIVAVLSVFAVFLGSPVFMVMTVMSAWLASITFRLYKHHRKCFWHLINLEMHSCPHCGQDIGSANLAEHLASSAHKEI